jgi:hypothetical protein
MAAPPLNLAARLAGAAVLLLAAGGCLVNSDEYNEARSQKEALRTELAKLRLGNDQLAQDIARLYTDREILSGHVAMIAALTLHNQMTTGFRPAPPPLSAIPAARPAAQAPRPARTSPPPAPAGTADAPPTGISRPGGAVDWGQ